MHFLGMGQEKPPCREHGQAGRVGGWLLAMTRLQALKR